MGTKYEKMDRENRAKQFMPFDALKGLREALAEKERVLVSKKELSEEEKDDLNRRLRQIRKGDRVTVEYIQSGEYVMITGMVSCIQETSRLLELVNTRISFDDISKLESNVLNVGNY